MARLYIPTTTKKQSHCGIKWRQMPSEIGHKPWQGYDVPANAEKKVALSSACAPAQRHVYQFIG
jgi:hypothetical protein